jgi:Fe2+ transport system protein FeoA
MRFAELGPGAVARVTRVGGQGAFRRRLMELGILPGTRLALTGIAPLGDPMELLVRGASLSIRRAEAQEVEVVLLDRDELARERAAESPTPRPVEAAARIAGSPDGRRASAFSRARARGVP